MSQATERQILKAVMEYLAAKRVLAFRMNVGAVEQTNAISGKKRFMRFGVAGMADVLACPRMDFDGKMVPHFVWLECKTATGRQSELQKSFQKRVESEGHLYRVVSSIEDLEEALR